MGHRIHSSQRDPITGFPIFVPSDHAYIHQGLGYSVIAVTDIDVDFFFYEESAT